MNSATLTTLAFRCKPTTPRHNTSLTRLSAALHTHTRTHAHTVQALGSHPLAATIRERLAGLKPAVPSLEGYHRIADPGSTLACTTLGTKLAFDPDTGAIVSLLVNGACVLAPQRGASTAC